uniref:Uncharacterized protein n=1 Tax=Glossina brevipalpis TaxID=37001 RepID=A0A1A9W367_9MUSC
MRGCYPELIVNNAGLALRISNNLVGLAFFSVIAAVCTNIKTHADKLDVKYCGGLGALGEGGVRCRIITHKFTILSVYNTRHSARHYAIALTNYLTCTQPLIEHCHQPPVVCTTATRTTLGATTNDNDNINQEQ